MPYLAKICTTIVQMYRIDPAKIFSYFSKNIHFLPLEPARRKLSPTAASVSPTPTATPTVVSLSAFSLSIIRLCL